jgi:hypothetical protein
LVTIKAFTARGPLTEVGRLVLLIPAFLSDLTAPVIHEAMASVRTIDVQPWLDTHLGAFMLVRRRRAPATRDKNCMSTSSLADGKLNSLLAPGGTTLRRDHSPWAFIAEALTQRRCGQPAPILPAVN